MTAPTTTSITSDGVHHPSTHTIEKQRVVSTEFQKRTTQEQRHTTPPQSHFAKFGTTYLGHYATEGEAHKVYTDYRAKEFTRLYMSYLDKENVSAEIRHRPDILRWSQIDGNWPEHSVHHTGVLEPCMGGAEESDVGSVQSTELLCSEVAPIATKKPQENINGSTDSDRNRYPRIAAC